MMLLTLRADWAIIAYMTTVAYHFARQKLTVRQSKLAFVAIFYAACCTRFFFEYKLEGFQQIAPGLTLGVLLVLGLLLVYNGERGKMSRFEQMFHYWFYPVHFLVLAILLRLM